MKVLCNEALGPNCRDRIHPYLEDSVVKSVWDQAMTCVNNTFATSSPEHVDYYRDENPVLEEMQD